MILLEVFFLSLGAGAVGLVFSFLGLGLLWLTGVPLNSFFLQMLFASDHVRPLFSLSSALISWVQLIVVGLLAGWYPAHVALKLSPLKAIQTD
jgi:ABC-type antimicrobial peptide transport system permease subunit